MSSVLRAEREKSLRRRYGSRTAQRPVHGPVPEAPEGAAMPGEADSPGR